MTIGQIMLAIAVGLAVSEFSEVCPWVARKLVRWSAHRRYVPPARAELRAEELTAFINDRPGRLFKLITALGFAAAAVVTRKVAPAGPPPNPLWWPTTLPVPVHYEEKNYLFHPNVRAVRQTWYQLTAEVRNAAKELGVGSRSWRCCMKELRMITGGDRWTLVVSNLEEINNLRAKLTMTRRCHRCETYCFFVPTDSTITHYQAAAETVRAEIRRLTSDFLLSSASR
jgi:hypothetical protein